MHVALVTAGGAGMFCGSCMHDNTWARSLMQLGAEVSLVPTYTPIRVDEQDVSQSSVLLGGINLYLEYRSRVWRMLPRPLTRWVDHPRVLNLVQRMAGSNDAARLGPLTLAMLAGESGPQRRAFSEFADYFGQHLQPDVICFSNALLSGAVRLLRERFDGPVFCTLQGDDIYLEALAEPYRTKAIDLLRERAGEFDGFLVHSEYYGRFMSEYLQLPLERFHQIPLGIDFAGHVGQPDRPPQASFTVGYFARICPEKGLHQLVDAFRRLREIHPAARLRAGGYLGPRDHDYFQGIVRDAADLGDSFRYVGSPPTLAEKVEFLQSIDVLSVPAPYREPKGLYVLEAWANGIPVVQPDHGAFPELIQRTGGGLLYPADAVDKLAEQLAVLASNPSQRRKLADSGYANVRVHYGLEQMAQATLDVFRRALPASAAG